MIPDAFKCYVSFREGTIYTVDALDVLEQKSGGKTIPEVGPSLEARTF